MYPQYMNILLYVVVIWCNNISDIYCQLECGGRVDVSSVYVHSAICDTYLVSCYSIDVLSIGMWGYMYPKYMCILLYITLIWCNSISEICCQL